MKSYEVTSEEETGIVHCRFNGFVSDAEADDLVKALTQAISAARRRHRRLRMFVDNRLGTVFSTGATAALAMLKSAYDRNDRTAVLVPGGLRKLQAERNVSDQTRVFLSEAEAMEWLRSGDEEQIG